jgi:signal transduction histidine kinase
LAYARKGDGSQRVASFVENANRLFYLFLYRIFYPLVSSKRGIEKLKNEFELEKERTENERRIELEKLKIKFLTNLSHELKTPLTLVLNPVESLLVNEQSEKKYKHSISLIEMPSGY